MRVQVFANVGVCPKRGDPWQSLQVGGPSALHPPTEARSARSRVASVGGLSVGQVKLLDVEPAAFEVLLPGAPSWPAWCLGIGREHGMCMHVSPFVVCCFLD